jgi:hypothetical protein
MAQDRTTHFGTLADLPFAENRPTRETAQTLRDELLFQRATQTYLWALPLVNNHNRRAAFAKSPEPGRLGDVLPTAPTGYICMLTD